MKKELALMLSICSVAGAALAGTAVNPAPIDALPKERPELKVWASRGAPLKIEELTLRLTPKALFERSSSAWLEERFEEASLLHMIGMIRLRTLASVPHPSAASHERQLESMSAKRSTMVNEWLLGDVPLAASLVELALKLDEEQPFLELDDLIQEARLRSRGAKLSAALGRKPYERLAIFLGLDSNRMKIYEIRMKQGKPIRDNDPAIAVLRAELLVDHSENLQPVFTSDGQPRIDPFGETSKSQSEVLPEVHQD